MRISLPPIYPITDKALSRKTTHLAILRELARGGATLVQIRDKDTSLRELLADLRRCAEFAERNRVLLIVNDRCDLALSCGASGVHLGQEDLPIEAARALLGHKRVLGLSVESISQLRKSLRMPVEYFGFGPIFSTATKPDAAPAVGLEELRRACRLSSKPMVAIGGIGLAQVSDVLGAGATSAAVISGLMCARSIAHEMEVFLRKAAETG
jgi:thiamine-phosphate pyrophosphorylase